MKIQQRIMCDVMQSSVDHPRRCKFCVYDYISVCPVARDRSSSLRQNKFQIPALFSDTVHCHRARVYPARRASFYLLQSCACRVEPLASLHQSTWIDMQLGLIAKAQNVSPPPSRYRKSTDDIYFFTRHSRIIANIRLLRKLPNS